MGPNVRAIAVIAVARMTIASAGVAAASRRVPHLRRRGREQVYSLIKLPSVILHSAQRQKQTVSTKKTAWFSFCDSSSARNRGSTQIAAVRCITADVREPSHARKTESGSSTLQNFKSLRSAQDFVEGSVPSSINISPKMKSSHAGTTVRAPVRKRR